jgi:hypothetical protein
MKIAVELVEALRYKLRMMGIPLHTYGDDFAPTNLYCDNEAVVTNSSRPESTLKKNTILFPIIGSEKLLQPEPSVFLRKTGTQIWQMDSLSRFLDRDSRIFSHTSYGEQSPPQDGLHLIMPGHTLEPTPLLQKGHPLIIDLRSTAVEPHTTIFPATPRQLPN